MQVYKKNEKSQCVNKIDIRYNVNYTKKLNGVM